eukprot:CAMPEP_0181322184 /NCGR_PEP_ID=MMETSP1101-20121128/19093_1 /TAXON_ID=46948 /ORGANISM="Rhodomonas abbreviata, Strain Caron Lab Isolate" /LENGTH=387 /DNA_ID=CAMNT_0023430081 /DNA_START=212 /DNA_END=1375 /DNA_ORIENTATION=+
MGCGNSKQTSGVAATESADGGVTKKEGGNIHDKYEMGKTLGSGSFATARIATRKDNGAKVAIKTLLRSHEMFDMELLQHEIDVMRKIDHPRCIRLLEVFEDAKAVHLVEELATGGELFDRILDLGHFSEKDAAKVIRQVIEGIEHMHSVGTVHRDLKPENLLMLSGDKNSPEYNHVKIADFGLSALMPAEDTSMSTVCGTPDYLAPEVIVIAAEGPHSRKKYDAKVDVWAIGVILYTMICGYPPFWSENIAEMLHLIKHGEYSFPSPAWDRICKDTKDFISWLLCVDPKKRPTAKQVLEHPWVANVENLSTEKLAIKDNLTNYVASRRTQGVFKAVRVITRLEMMSRQGGGHSGGSHAELPGAGAPAAAAPAAPAAPAAAPEAAAQA